MKAYNPFQDHWIDGFAPWAKHTFGKVREQQLAAQGGGTPVHSLTHVLPLEQTHHTMEATTRDFFLKSLNQAKISPFYTPQSLFDCAQWHIIFSPMHLLRHWSLLLSLADLVYGGSSRATPALL